MISKSLSTSEKRARLHSVAERLAEFCQALYPLMVVHTDDFGRHAGDPFTVKHQIEPTSRRSLDEFARALQHLHEVELIVWYEANGKRYYQIVDFDDHQPGLHKRTKSRIPEPPGISRKAPETPPELNGTEEKGTPPLPPAVAGGRRRRSVGVELDAEQQRRTREVRRLVQEEGLSFAEASARVGYQ